MDAICIPVQQWLFLNSTSFIQMNDGLWYSALCGNINIHQRPAPLTKSENWAHLLFKWQTACQGRDAGRGDFGEEADKPIQISILGSRAQEPRNHQSNEKRQAGRPKRMRGSWMAPFPIHTSPCLLPLSRIVSKSQGFSNHTYTRVSKRSCGIYWGLYIKYEKVNNNKLCILSLHCLYLMI